MQQTTNRHLYEYWNRLRRDRPAPWRYEVEPARIAHLLPETFIVECDDGPVRRFRLAGTRICETFGRELRGFDLMNLWSPADRDRLQRLLAGPALDGAVGTLVFDGFCAEGRKARFEMVLLPLMHRRNRINRLLGAISAMQPPYWLGTSPILRQKVVGLDVLWPEIAAAPDSAPTGPVRPSDASARRFGVVQGGLADSP